jgi:hypothetical protein
MGPDAQAIFDKVVAAYRMSGWQDDGGFGRRLGRAAHRELWTTTTASVPVTRAEKVNLARAAAEANERSRQRFVIQGIPPLPPRSP